MSMLQFMNHAYWLALPCIMHVLCIIIYFVSGPNKGIPNVLMRKNNQTKFIDPSLLPEADNAVWMYEAHGGQVILFGNFGSDPLLQRSDYPKLEMKKFLNSILHLRTFFVLQLTPIAQHIISQWFIVFY